MIASFAIVRSSGYQRFMPTWDADQYLRFNEQRTRPCRDLVGRISIAHPKRVIDLGCGPGNSTAVLAERWPQATVIGLDGSAEMITAARQSMPELRWQTADIAVWGNQANEMFDVVFSNAALQWVDDHAALFPKLFNRVASAGALAIQVPGNFDAPAHRIMRGIAATAPWPKRFGAKLVREWHVHDLPFYYDLLARMATSVDFWETEYLHVLPDVAAIVDWYKGTGLRPFLDALASDEHRQQFTDAYLQQIRIAFPTRADGRVIFPFRRLFMIAYR